MSLKHNLIKLLADGKFHSGEELGSQLNVSRNAVWKALQDFSKLGIEVHRVKGKGYLVPNGLELLDHDKIINLILPSVKQNVNIEVLSEIDSTNQYLLDSINKKPSGSIVLAEHQTNGRGRRHRPWVSPFGTNLYFSILWSFDKDPSELGGLSLAAGVAVAQTLERYGIPHVQLKWPNDIFWDKKKLSGVLIEISGETNSTTKVVMGIGINLQMPSHVDIQQEWIDVSGIINRRPARNEIAAFLIEEIVAMLQVFEQKGFDAYFKHWRALDATLGKPVKIVTSTQEFFGIGNGINRLGEFILLDANNNELRFLQGEVSLRLGLRIIQDDLSNPLDFIA